MNFQMRFAVSHQLPDLQINHLVFTDRTGEEITVFSDQMRAEYHGYELEITLPDASFICHQHPFACDNIHNLRFSRLMFSKPDELPVCYQYKLIALQPYSDRRK